MSRDDQTAAELTRAAALAQLALGAAHSLNNAFTVVMGEIGFLLDDHKDDPELCEALSNVRREMDRCTSITRVLLTQRHAATNAETDVDLTRLTHDLGKLLQHTLARRVDFEVETPDDVLVARGSAGPVQSAAVAAAHLLVAETQQGVTLRIRPGSGPDGPRLEFVLRGAEVDDALVARLADGSDSGGTLLRALRRVLSADGGSVQVERRGSDGCVLRLQFPG